MLSCFVLTAVLRPKYGYLFCVSEERNQEKGPGNLSMAELETESHPVFNSMDLISFHTILFQKKLMFLFCLLLTVY